MLLYKVFSSAHSHLLLLLYKFAFINHQLSHFIFYSLFIISASFKLKLIIHLLTSFSIVKTLQQSQCTLCSLWHFQAFAHELISRFEHEHLFLTLLEWGLKWIPCSWLKMSLLYKLLFFFLFFFFFNRCLILLSLMSCFLFFLICSLQFCCFLIAFFSDLLLNS